MHIFVKTTVLVLTTVMLLAMCSCSGRTLTYEKAQQELTESVATIKANTLPVKLDPNEKFDPDQSAEKQALPDLSEYPYVVNPTTPIFITTYSENPQVIQAANNFNSAGIVVDGQQVSVGVRSVGSALATNFILANKYTPDVLIPASRLYGDILSYNGARITQVADATVRSLSGIVVPNSIGVNDFSGLVRRVHSGDLSIGYVDPLQNPDGLNFVLSVLCEFDSSQPISEAAIEGLKELQNNVTCIATDGAQLKVSFLRGFLDGYVLDYGTFKSAAEYTTGHKFIPFGIPQDNPAYAIGDPTPLKMQTIQEFVRYCGLAEGTKDSIVTNYSSNIVSTSALAGALRGIYRSVRGGGSSGTAAVFVADISGSMAGTPLRKLKTGLRGSINAIDPSSSVGLVTFETQVNIALPIAPFDGRQQSYFSNAITNMAEGSNTAMYNAIAVALEMLLEYEKENPGTRLILFVLTDGDSNVGYNFNKMRPIIAALQIPIYTIGYESERNGLKTGTLENLSLINEAYFTNAYEENITYLLASLLGSQA